ncbi:hypothetical protein G7Y31_05555 [Corynebacterium lizhenjunii]|uniref:Uncharacterized protein n=1 Tax=Corynebacterium lizhenjunii TaxID=2709394 RepID=A0A7T0PBG7_9CORY|nr:hypothetical protein [Corynebacterium lizhenjunii]QPK80146.1 hypothetical protein G7Y31_05555 [Corynebacterium lizhenjunii]
MQVRRAIAATVVAGAVLSSGAWGAHAVPAGVSMADVLAAVSAPVAVPAGQTTTVSLPVPVEVSFNADGWSVQASGGTATVSAPAAGGEAVVPVSYAGQTINLHLVAQAGAEVPELADAPAPHDGASAAPGVTPEGGAGPDGGGADVPGAGSEGGVGADAESRPTVPGDTPPRSPAAPVDATQAERIYLQAQIQGNTLTATLGVSQALELYNRFKDVDQAGHKVRYLDADGNIIEGVRRDIQAAQRTMVLTYPEGQAPDNPFIIQLVERDGSRVVAEVVLRDPAYRYADSPSPEQLAQEEQGIHDGGRWSLGVLALVAVAGLVLVGGIGLGVWWCLRGRRQ